MACCCGGGCGGLKTGCAAGGCWMDLGAAALIPAGEEAYGWTVPNAEGTGG